MATLLDPRFTTKGFSTASFAEMAKSLVLNQVREMSENSATTTPKDSDETHLIRNLGRNHHCLRVIT